MSTLAIILINSAISIGCSYYAYYRCKNDIQKNQYVSMEPPKSKLDEPLQLAESPAETVTHEVAADQPDWLNSVSSPDSNKPFAKLGMASTGKADVSLKSTKNRVKRVSSNVKNQEKGTDRKEEETQTS